VSPNIPGNSTVLTAAILFRVVWAERPVVTAMTSGPDTIIEVVLFFNLCSMVVVTILTLARITHL
jgi:hypothetical protein